jgi:UDP-N-acetyl-2-amino-2-deoxyglucuronate dehydrogenase
LNNIIKYCLIGCGRISKNHIESIQKIQNASLLSICDINENTLKETAQKYNIKNTYQDYKEMLIQQQPDAVIICTPSGLHSEMGIFAAEKKINVITEKPISITLKQADDLINACENNNIKLFVVKQNRLNHPIQLLKRAIDKNRFGQIFTANITVHWTRPQAYYDMSKWRGTKQLDGGAFLNQASHYFDLLSWMLGEVDSVMAFTATQNHKIECEDTGVAIIKFTSGTLGSVSVTMNTYPKNWEGSITVIGEFGSVKIGGVAVNRVEHWEFKDYDDDDKLINITEPLPTNVSGTGHYGFLSNVNDVLLDKIDVFTDGIQARKSLEIILAMYESAEKGIKIKLPLKK